MEPPTLCHARQCNSWSIWMSSEPQKYGASIKKDHSRATSEELSQSIAGWAPLLNRSQVLERVLPLFFVLSGWINSLQAACVGDMWPCSKLQAKGISQPPRAPKKTLVCFDLGHICKCASGYREKGVLTFPGTKLASRAGSKCKVPSGRWDSSFPLACHKISDFLGAYLS